MLKGINFEGITNFFSGNKTHNSENVKLEKKESGNTDSTEQVQVVNNTKTEVENALDETTNTKLTLNKNSLSLDILDLSSIIDIFAEMKAVETFDEKMRDSKNGNMFQKAGGFFMRSFQRMGRDAYIDSLKLTYIDEINEGLDNGTYNESYIKEHVLASDIGIEKKAFLGYEEKQEEEKTPAEVQKIINDWLSATDTNARKGKIKELKNALEDNYPVIADLNQLELSLLRLEKAKIGLDLDTIEAKLNILDIGGIESGDGERKESLVVKGLDGINNFINKSWLPDWGKKIIGGFIQHPNTAAVVSAMGTRLLVSSVVSASVISGFLAPVAVGALAGGYLASGRARREMRDRTAQIDRRGALGNQTGNKEVDGESSNNSHKTKEYQQSSLDLYNKIALLDTFDKNNSDYNKIKEEALASGIDYLVRHLVGRDKGLNMLQYESNKSVSSQHVDIIILLNKLFPELVSKFNSKKSFNEITDSEYSKIINESYAKIDNLANYTIKKRSEEETKYATRQGLIFGAVAAGFGLSMGGLLHLYDTYTSGHYDVTGTSASEYPDKMEAYSSVKRDFWFDNNTAKFDNTELMVHTDKSGGWNVAKMIGKTPFTNGHSISHLSGTDFSSNNIQAVLTPKNGGPSFVLPIDSDGNIQIPKSMQSDFDSRNFAFLEVGKVDVTSGTINIDPIATVKGHGTMVFEKQAGEVIKTFVRDDSDWYGNPFGGNRYHELGEEKSKSPIIVTSVQKRQTKTPTVVTPKSQEKTEESTIVTLTQNNQTEIPTIETDLPENQNDNNLELVPNYDSLFEKENIDNRGELTKLNEELISITKQKESLTKEFNLRKKLLTSTTDLTDDEVELTLLSLNNQLSSKIKEFVAKSKKNEEEKIEEEKANKYEENIKNLSNSELLATLNGKPLMYNWKGRTFISVKTRNGGIIPFYRSSNGTSGKDKGTWYPSFGITEDDSWIIKGSLQGLQSGHGKEELKDIQDKLNESLNWPANLDTDFNYNKSKHPLSKMGVQSNKDWITQAEGVQKSSKPKSHDDGLANDWINEWVNRVTKPKDIL